MRQRSERHEEVRNIPSIIHAIRLTLAALAMLALTTAVALPDEWSAAASRGTVLSLVGGQWNEVERGTVINGYAALRTLQSGRLELVGDSGMILVGPNSALELVIEPRTAATLVRQYSGSVTLDTNGETGRELRLETDHLTVIPNGGSLTVVIASGTSQVRVASGSAAIASTATGEVVTAASGAIVGSAGAGGLEVAGATPEAGDKSGAASAGNAGDAGHPSGSSHPGNPNPGNPNPGNPNPGNPNPGNPNPGNPNPGNPNPGNPSPGNPNPGNSNPGNHDPGNPNSANPDPGRQNPGHGRSNGGA